jgi:hypothetical protein
MTFKYTKTDAGRDEIKTGSRKLPRTARNLLLIIDGTRSGDEWVKLVQGATPADLDLLVETQMVSKVQRAATSAELAAEATAALNAALSNLSYEELYALLTNQARERFGLVKGYKMVLEVEKCSGPEQIKALAARFLTMVHEEQGPEEARKLRVALGVRG